MCQGRCHEVLENMVKVVLNNYVAENHQLTLESGRESLIAQKKFVELCIFIGPIIA